MPSKSSPASFAALGGVLAALAVTIMSLGTVIPVATYVCPVLCTVILRVVLKICGLRIAWAWYGAVAILSVLLAPDKEAALVFAAIGYYPNVKPELDRRKGKFIWKILLFNASILAVYYLMMRVLGMQDVAEDFSGIGAGLYVAMLLLGNVTFFLLDRLLEMPMTGRKQ